ncbi:flavodoxin family protein [Methanospirillum lacunae]|nr:flavodoxin family protein [Methanospirillum lacunae]
MKITTICGSNRRKGATKCILGSIEKEIKQANISGLKTKNISLSDVHLEPCKGCLKCKKKGHCVIPDDFGKIAFRMIHSDLIVIGSPVYFSDVSSPVKALIDRSVSLWHTKLLKDKKVIFVAATMESGTEHTLETLKIWAKDHEMNVISTIEGIGEEVKDVLSNEKTIQQIKDSVGAFKLTLPCES